MRKVACVLLGLAVAIPGAAHPSTASAKEERCEASWYGPGFHGRKMANGAVFNQNNPKLVAHKSYPFGTRLEVTNLENGRTLLVTVTDRGPYIKGRCVDLSKAGAIALGYLNSGSAPVEVRVVN